VWWNGQNLDMPITAPDGERWHFRIWHGQEDGVYTQRLFFWNDERTETGLVELRAGETLHTSRIKSRLAKLATDPDYRRQFLRPLRFPLERHW
jgi:hypothetical protein